MRAGTPAAMRAQQHIQSLLAEAVCNTASTAVARFLGVYVPEDGDILARLHTSGASTEAAVAFSRFLPASELSEQPVSAATGSRTALVSAAGAQV